MLVPPKVSSSILCVSERRIRSPRRFLERYIPQCPFVKSWDGEAESGTSTVPGASVCMLMTVLESTTLRIRTTSTGVTWTPRDRWSIIHEVPRN